MHQVGFYYTDISGCRVKKTSKRSQIIVITNRTYGLVGRTKPYALLLEKHLDKGQKKITLEKNHRN